LDREQREPRHQIERQADEPKDLIARSAVGTARVLDGDLDAFLEASLKQGL